MNILLVEDEGMVRSGFKALIHIAAPSAQIYEAGDPASAMKKLEDHGPIEIAFVDAK